MLVGSVSTPTPSPRQVTGWQEQWIDFGFQGSHVKLWFYINVAALACRSNDGGKHGEPGPPLSPLCAGGPFGSLRHS